MADSKYFNQSKLIKSCTLSCSHSSHSLAVFFSLSLCLSFPSPSLPLNRAELGLRLLSFSISSRAHFIHIHSIIRPVASNFHKYVARLFVYSLHWAHISFEFGLNQMSNDEKSRITCCAVTSATDARVSHTIQMNFEFNEFILYSSHGYTIWYNIISFEITIFVCYSKNSLQLINEL